MCAQWPVLRKLRRNLPSSLQFLVNLLFYFLKERKVEYKFRYNFGIKLNPIIRFAVDVANMEPFQESAFPNKAPCFFYVEATYIHARSWDSFVRYYQIIIRPLKL